MSLLADRHELKFEVSAEQRARLLDMAVARGLLAPDPFGSGRSYRVSSQYFDTPDLLCYREKKDGVAERRKLRLRWYGRVDDDATFAERAFFLEIKHRISATLHKERLRVTGAGARAILDDPLELLRVHEHVVLAAPGERADATAIAGFERLAAERYLVASNVITYLREAWDGTIDRRLRVTFDALIRALPPDGWLHVSGDGGPRLLPPQRLLLELKYDGMLPAWMKDALRSLDVAPVRFSKYAYGVEALRSRRSAGAAPPR